MRSTATSRDARRRGRAEKSIFGVPERFEKPRLLLYLATFALVAYGLLMIYSSSSIVALTGADTDHNPAYYLIRQLIFVGGGLAAAVVIACVDYHFWANKFIIPIWLFTVFLLGLVIFSSSGTDAYGATRWIQIGSFSLQPSEFAKVTIVLVTASLCGRYFETGELEEGRFVGLMAAAIVIPLGLFLLQPDKGSTMICGLTLLVMFYFCGVPGEAVGVVTLGLAVIFFGYSMRDAYSRQRFLTFLNPWADRYGNGYQLVQGFYAFGSGGIFGVGIGASRQKYSYLPMAYNDFIFSIVGEECGLVGTLAVLALFALLFWSAIQIARYAPDLTGRLIAAGSASLLIIQLFVNICGVLGIMPMTGKPVPFMSYGGSSIISCLMLVGLIASVSRASPLEETESDRRRQDLSVHRGSAYDGEGYGPESGQVGEPVPRSARVYSRAASAYEDDAAPSNILPFNRGGQRPSVQRPSAQGGSALGQSPRTKGRVTTDRNGRRRIHLEEDAADRLRGARSSSNQTSYRAPGYRSRNGRDGYRDR